MKYYNEEDEEIIIGSGAQYNDKRHFFQNRYFKLGMTLFIVVALSLLFYYLLFHYKNLLAGLSGFTKVLTPVIMAFIISYLLTPILNWIEYKLLRPIFTKLFKRMPKDKTIRGISVLLTVLSSIFVLYLLFYALLSQIIPSIANIINNFDSYTNNTINWVNNLFQGTENQETGNFLIRTINNYSEDIEKWLDENVYKNLLAKTNDVVRTVSSSLLGFIKWVWNLIIGFIIAIYVLGSKERYIAQAKKIAFATFERERANQLIQVVRFIHNTFIGFIAGKILDSICIGLLCFIGTTILQTPYAALVSLIIGVTNIIPFFGPYLGAIPSIILVFVVDPMHPLNVVYLAIFILILQQIDGNVIGPKILGDSTGLNGFWVIFAITVFGGLMGIPGMIIGVPTFACIYNGIKILLTKNTEKKNVPSDTDKYMDLNRIEDDGSIQTYIPESKLPYKHQEGEPKSTTGKLIQKLKTRKSKHK